jgi:hypothetical protein
MRAFFWVASIFTVLGVSIGNMFTFWSSGSPWEKFGFTAGLLAGLVILVIDTRIWWKSRAKRYKTPEAVNKYLLNLLQRGGSLAIFANNLSWIQASPKIKSWLESQAKEGKDIRIIVPKHNELTLQLAAAGVDILAYPNLEYEPESRFTLLNPNEPGSSLLAIGKGVFPNFYIDEFTDSTHARVISVVRDLLNIAERAGNRANT